MSVDQLRKFLNEMQNDDSLRNQVITSSTADDVALIALKRGYEFSGDELLRFSGNKVGRVTVQKNDVPGEYNWTFYFLFLSSSTIPSHFFPAFKYSNLFDLLIE